MSNDRPNAWPPGNQGGWPAPTPSAAPLPAPADGSAAWAPRTAGTGPLPAVTERGPVQRDSGMLTGPPQPVAAGPAAPAYGVPPQVQAAPLPAAATGANPYDPTVSAYAAPQVAAPVAQGPTPPPYTPPSAPQPARHPLEAAYSVVERIRARVRAAVRGRDEVVELVIMAMLADGHVLLEDFPGSGKTTLAKALGDALEVEQRADHIVAMRRVQFTPDLLPSDITGTTIFDPATNQFYFRPGPVFAHILLADEINRTSPKVQAALLEAMGEKQATIDNTTHRLDDLFFVVATQNPLDLAGTFPLPSAQLDRFLFKIRMTHIDKASELDVLHSIRERRDTGAGKLPKVTRDEVVLARKAIEQNIHVAPEVLETLVDIAAATRADERIMLGVSTRSLVLAVPALQARALSLHRGFVSPEDIEALAVPLFAHRMEMAPGIDDTAAVIRDCIRGPLEALTRRTFKR